MKKLTLIAAALSACLAGGAYAASTDGLPNTGGGDGMSGDLILAAVNQARTQSLVWDLSSSIAGLEDVTHGGLLNWAAANPGGSFTLNNATVSGLIDATWDWHVFSFANVQTPDSMSSPAESINVGVLTTVDAPINPSQFLGGDLRSSINDTATWVGLNTAQGLDNNVVVATDADPWFWTDAFSRHGDFAFSTDITTGVGGTLDVQLLKQQNGPIADAFDFMTFMNVVGTNNLPTELSDVGSFTFAANGDLTFNTTVVPVPAAVWLMGSAIAGLGAVRRKAAAKV